MDYAELRRQILERLALPKYKAGRALGLGRHATDLAVEAGAIPVIDGPHQTVPTEWLRQKLQIGGRDKHGRPEATKSTPPAKHPRGRSRKTAASETSELQT